MSNTTPQDKERRQFTRIAFDADAEVFTGEQAVKVQVTDISLKGALIETPHDTKWHPSMGDHCEIVIDLDGQHTKIYMHTRVAYVRDNNIGLVCEHIDIQSIGHLRRLVELNLGDPALLDRELKALSISGISSS